MSQFINKMESYMSLFVSVHGRKPNNYEEFEKWIEVVEANSRTTNSRSPIMDIHEANEKNDASF
jgi:hypothetical protein